MHHWLGERGPLRFLADKPITDIEAERPIGDYISSNGVWMTEEFSGNLPTDVVNEVASSLPCIVANTSATCVWYRDAKGFSVGAAYCLLKEDDWGDASPRWKLAWSWTGPQRIRTFLWLVLSKKLLTNKERHRRHMTEEAHCEFCGHEVEDTEHVLRGCEFAQTCWRFIIPRDKEEGFYALPLDQWLHVNLKDGQTNAGWSTMFGILCWKFWRARNNRIFSNEEPQPYQLILEAVSMHGSVIQATNSISQVRLH